MIESGHRLRSEELNSATRAITLARGSGGHSPITERRARSAWFREIGELASALTRTEVAGGRHSSGRTARPANRRHVSQWSSASREEPSLIRFATSCWHAATHGHADVDAARPGGMTIAALATRLGAPSTPLRSKPPAAGDSGERATRPAPDRGLRASAAEGRSGGVSRETLSIQCTRRAVSRETAAPVSAVFSRTAVSRALVGRDG